MNSTKLIVWDVEHGSAAYIQSPNGKHIVIDAGSGSFKNGRTFSPLYHLYNRYGVQSIDYAIITKMLKIQTALPPWGIRCFPCLLYWELTNLLLY